MSHSHSICIDFREKDILKYCTEMNKNNIDIKIENLLLGDILIDKLLIERKTINDLAASIVDGRYKEQSFRLIKAVEEGYKVFYFIEGNMDLYTGSISKNTIVSTIYSLTHKGFQVLLTKNSKDTSFFILQFAEKMKKESEKNEKMKKIPKHKHEDECGVECESLSISNSICNESNKIKESVQTPVSEVSYENTPGIIQTKKNKNITKDNISVFMLCQIPGISTTTAGILLEKYGHISKLIIAMKENPKEINDFKHNDKKLNKNIIHNLNEFLCCNI
jgi:ERCC4-type nuclease